MHRDMIWSILRSRNYIYNICIYVEYAFISYLSLVTEIKILIYVIMHFCRHYALTNNAAMGICNYAFDSFKPFCRKLPKRDIRIYGYDASAVQLENDLWFPFGSFATNLLINSDQFDLDTWLLSLAPPTGLLSWAREIEIDSIDGNIVWGEAIPTGGRIETDPKEKEVSLSYPDFWSPSSHSPFTLSHYCIPYACPVHSSRMAQYAFTY